MAEDDAQHTLDALTEQKSQSDAMRARQRLKRSAVDEWEKHTVEVMIRYFGADSQFVKDVKRRTMHVGAFTDISEQERHDREVAAVDLKMNGIDSAIKFLTNDLARRKAKVDPMEVEKAKRVFLVHGHDQEVTQEVATFIEKLGLSAIILTESINQGQTIIEKFERESNVSFAVILMTADDVGRSKAENSRKQKLRARQNVILELGYFVGKLGRSKICVLCHAGVDVPSDFHGVVYVPIDENGAWMLRLAKEMKAAGLKVDTTKIL